MKKLISILLLAGLLTAVTACGKGGESAETTGTGEAEIPGDTVLVGEGYEGLNFSEYLEIPDLSTVRGSLADVEAEWDAVAEAIRYENIILTDAAEGDTAELCDQVNIHYKGYAASDELVLSEATLANMTNISHNDEGELSDGYDLVLGSNSFIGAYESEEAPEKNNPSFEEQLVGMKAGDSRTITVTFPDNYGSDELNGSVIKFDVTVNSLKKGTLPDLTDEMVADYTADEYTTIEAAKAYIINAYKSNFAYAAVTGAFTVKDYPEELIDSAITEYVTNYISYTYEETLTDEEIQTVFDEQYDNAMTSAKETVGQRLILEYLFDHFGVSLTQAEYLEMRSADYEENYLYYYYNYGISDVETLESVFGKDLMVAQYKYDKLAALLADTVIFE